MVNVGGRSKGCSTCRRRRVKCDETSPICRRCQRWNLKCDGPKGIAFVYTQPAGSSGQSGSLTSSLNVPTSTTEADPVVLHALPRPIPNMYALGFDVYICYTRKYLLRDGLIVTAITNMTYFDIRCTEITVPQQHISHQAILSFATVLFGMQHQQVDVARQGYTMYGVALKQLNQVLSDPSQHTSDEVITAVAAMSVAECLVPTGKENYLKHMMGLQRLVDLQNPNLFWPIKPYGFRDGVRFMLLLVSWQLKIPCILARDEWKRALRINCSPKQLQDQDLFDVLADYTVLQNMRESVVALKNLDEAKSMRLRTNAVDLGESLLHSLRVWKRRWDVDMVGSGFLENSSTKGVTRNRCTTSITIDDGFRDHSRIVTLMLYNLVHVCVLQALVSLTHIKSQTGDLRHDIEAVRITSSYAVGERRAAQEVCRCVQVYMERRPHLDAGTPPSSIGLYRLLGPSFVAMILLRVIG